MIGSSQESIQKPIFVIGSARSGTVLLGEVLKNHPAVHCLIERPDVFQYASYLALNPQEKVGNEDIICGHLRELYQQAWKISFTNCLSCSSICKEKSGFRGFALRACETPDEIQRFADKSHQHLLNVDLILQAFPDAQFIYLVRDGRDVVSSMLRHPGVLSWFSTRYINQDSSWPSPWFGIEDLEHYQRWLDWSDAMKSAQRWVSWSRIGMQKEKELPSRQWLTIHYEGLVGQPELTGEQIFSFLGISPDRSTLKDVFSSSVGNWRKYLLSQQVDEIMPLIRDTLKILGYDL